MYVCIFIYIKHDYIHIHIHIHTYIYIYIHIYIYIYTCIYTYIYIYIYACIYIYVSVCYKLYLYENDQTMDPKNSNRANSLVAGGLLVASTLGDVFALDLQSEGQGGGGAMTCGVKGRPTRI